MKKSKSKPEKKITGNLKKDGDQLGAVTLTFDDGDTTEFKISYELEADEDCGDECYLAIYDGISCGDKGDKFFDTEDNPWNDEDSNFSASDNGFAAGSITVDNGYTWADNHCRVMVVYGPAPSKSQPKSKKRRDLKKKSKGGPDVLMCGVLKKKGFDGSCSKPKSRRA